MITKYEALLCAIETGTIAKAAENLGYTTSGISRMISSIEDELGLTLLVRKKSGVIPTDECINLMPHFRNLINAYSALNQSADELKGLITGNITVATSMEAYIPLLSDLVGKFKEIYPGIHVNVLEDYSTPLSRLIEDGKADFCIMSRRPGRFSWKTIRTDPLVVVVHPDHRFAKMKTVPLEMLSEETFIAIQNEIETDNVIMFRKNNTHMSNSLSCSNNFAAATMIEAGLGVTIENEVNTKVWNKNIISIPLDPPQLVEIGIATPESGSISPAARRFIDFAEEKMKDI